MEDQITQTTNQLTPRQRANQRYKDKTREKAPVIQLLKETAPWVLISKAAKETGIPEVEFKTNLRDKMRKFGNTLYINPVVLNKFITSGTEK